jgi:RHS repeat-associated protein
VDAVLSDISGATTARYLPGISEQRGGVSTYFHDGIKNAITQTNASQSVTATKRYDAFGLQASSTGTWKSPFGYGGPWGYQEDGDAYNLKLLGHRYYDPSLGRFLSRDVAKSGGNWYAYCAGDPILNADPEGYWFKRLVEIAILVRDFVNTQLNGPSPGPPPIYPPDPREWTTIVGQLPKSGVGSADGGGGPGGALGAMLTIGIGLGAAADGIRVVHRQRKRFERFIDDANDPYDNVEPYGEEHE